MTFPGNCYRIVLGGAMPSGEVWSAGFYCADPGGSATAQSTAQAVANTIQTAGLAAAWFNTYTAAGTTLSKVTAYKYGTGSAAVDVYTQAVTGVTAGSGAVMPNQIALVITLRSATSTRSGRGRMYLPCNAAGAMNATTAYANATCITNAITWVRLMMNSFSPLVVSKTQTAKYPVTSLSADTILDTMRSRTDRLVSSKTTQAL